MGQCLGPCISAVSRKEYAGVIKEVIMFLEGKQDKVVRGLKYKMNRAADILAFEKATMYRNQIQAMEKVVEGQRIAATVSGEQDVIAFTQDGDQAYVQVFFIRNNMLTGRESFMMQGTQHEEPRQVMTDFVKQCYSSSPNIPPRLLLQYPVEEVAVLKGWLQSRRGGKVDIKMPRRGKRKHLVDMVTENARQGLEQLKIRQTATPKELESAMEEIQKELKLPSPPLRIEAYDISNIQGQAAVGSMAVFEKGKSKPAHYRRFRIKTVSSTDDYAMLQEVLRRRFKRISEETTLSDTWAIDPDLVLIDGGKGQLNAALSAIKVIT